jgi:hypothetical protein
MLLGSCARFERTKECAQLIDRVNESLREITKESKLDNAETAAIAKEASALADRYDQLAAHLKALNLADSELKAFGERYRTLAEGAARTLRAVAEARTRQDFGTADARRKEYDAQAKAEAPLVEELNRYCSR